MMQILHQPQAEIDQGRADGHGRRDLVVVAIAGEVVAVVAGAWSAKEAALKARLAVGDADGAGRGVEVLA
jgi:phosphopantetheinyl transferase (holo-ACP synthase)